MKTIEELAQFYDTELMQSLNAMEEQRRKVVSQTLLICGVLAVTGVGVALFMMAQGAPPIGLIITLVVCVVVGGGFYSFKQRDYRFSYKRLIIGRVIGFAQPGMEYLPEQGISQSVFSGAKIFTHSIDRYKSEDLVRGKVDKTEIQFSEIHAEYKTTSGSGKHRHTEWHTIFKGLFVVADFNKNFCGRTVVLPDTAQKAFGAFGQTLQSWNMGRDTLVRLEDPEFEREFVVYSLDQVEARYILSPALMQRIVEFRRRLKHECYFSFVGSNVYIAIPLDVDLFEPKTFSPASGFDSIKTYYDQLRFGLGVVDELNLNTRIWTKE